MSNIMLTSFISDGFTNATNAGFTNTSRLINVTNEGDTNATFQTESGATCEDVANTTTKGGIRFIVISSFGTVLSCWIILSNILIIVATFRRTRLKTRTGYFICSLALADLTSGVCNFISGYMRSYGDSSYGNGYICGIYVAIQVFPFLVSLASLTCMALDRYLAVVLPLKSKTILTKSRSLWIICTSWVASLAVSSPTLFWNTNPKHELCTLRHMNRNYFFYVFQGSFWLLLTIKIYMYIMVIYKLRENLAGFKQRQERRLLESTPTVFSRKKLSSEIQLTKMVLIVLALFLLSWLPMILLYNFYFLHCVGRRFTSILSILAYAHSGVNLLLYLGQSRDYRRACKKLLCSCCNEENDVSLTDSSDPQRSQGRNTNTNTNTNSSI